MVAADPEALVRHQPHDQSDAQFQEERLGGAGDIGSGQVADGHAHCSRQAAPITAYEQGSQDAEDIAEVKGRLLRSHRNVDLKKSKPDIAESRKKSRLCQPFYIVSRRGNACNGIVNSLNGQQDRKK